MGEEPEVLKDHAHGAADLFEVCLVLGTQLMTAYGDGARVKGIQTIDTTEESRFPSSRRAEQTDCLPLFYIQRNAIQDGFTIVAFREIVDGDEVFRSRSPF